MDCALLHTIQLDVIFNFARYEELREAVQQLLRDNLDPDLLHEEAHDPVSYTHLTLPTKA